MRWAQSRLRRFWLKMNKARRERAGCRRNEMRLGKGLWMSSTIRRAALVFGVLALFAVGCDSGAPKDPGAAGSAGIGQVPPDFTLAAVHGPTIQLSALKGKVVILDFWATWCPPCRVAIPHMVELQKKYLDQGLAVVGMNLDQNVNDLVGFMGSNEINFPIVQAPEKIKLDYKVSSIPRVFLIDREGKVRGDWLGFDPQVSSEIEAAVKKYLAN